MPADKRPVENKRSPFISTHHPSGENKRLSVPNIRILRQNVRNHLIRISFYDSSDHCQIPQKNKERHFKHSERRFLSAFYTPWKQQSSNFTLSIGTVFQQKTALPHTKYIADKCIKQKQKHDPRQNDHALGSLVFKQNIVHGVHKTVKGRFFLCHLIVDMRQHALFRLVMLAQICNDSVFFQIAALSHALIPVIHNLRIGRRIKSSVYKI